MQYPHLFIVTNNSQPWTYADYTWSVFQNILSYPGPKSVFRAIGSRADQRQNLGVLRFLESDADILVKMDLDQEYPVDYFRIMVPLVFQYKVIGPEIYDRWEENDYGILCFSDKSDLSGSWIDSSDESGIKAYPYTHTNNFYLREVVENVPLPWYTTESDEKRIIKKNHTDFDLLDKIKAAGYKIYLNHNIEVNHLFIGKANRDFHKRHMRGKYGEGDTERSERFL